MRAPISQCACVYACMHVCVSFQSCQHNKASSLSKSLVLVKRMPSHLSGIMFLRAVLNAGEGPDAIMFLWAVLNAGEGPGAIMFLRAVLNTGVGPGAIMFLWAVLNAGEGPGAIMFL